MAALAILLVEQAWLPYWEHVTGVHKEDADQGIEDSVAKTFIEGLAETCVEEASADKLQEKLLTMVRVSPNADGGWLLDGKVIKLADQSFYRPVTAVQKAIKECARPADPATDMAGCSTGHCIGRHCVCARGKVAGCVHINGCGANECAHRLRVIESRANAPHVCVRGMRVPVPTVPVHEAPA